MIKRPLCAAAVFFLGIQAVLACGFQTSKDLKPTLLETALESEETVKLEGTVFRREEKPEYKVLYLKDNSIYLKNQLFRESKILVYIKTNDPISIGNHIRVTGKASAFQAARNPGNFDQKFYYQKQGIHASVWANQSEILGERVYKLRENLAVLRASWKAVLIKYLGDYYGNCMSAILLGDKSELDSELKELYQRSGIGHILAISGLHMSFLGSSLYKVLRKAGIPFLIAGSIGMCFLAAYTMMIGCGVSSLRALTMFIVRIGADITGRDYDMPTSLAVAAAAITAWQPLYIMDAGFLLSFGALVGIAGLSPCIAFCLKGEKSNKKWLDSFCASLGVNLTLLPIMLYFYFEFPPYSIFLNLLIIPLMSFVLGAGVIGSIIQIVHSGAGGLVLGMSKWILYIYEKSCKISMKLPGSQVITGQPKTKYILVYYFVLIVLCATVYIYKHNKKNGKNHVRLKRKATCLAGSLSMILLVSTLILSCGMGHGNGVEVTMLDVGQGDGLYIRGPEGKHYFIDGGSSDVSSVGKYRIEPFLKSQGTGVLDYVFISHGDADHMNGIEEMLDNQALGVRIQTLVFPPEEVMDDSLKNLAVKAKKNGTHVVSMEAGDILEEGELKLFCIAPMSSYVGETGNAASMVLNMTYETFDMLFTGDVEDVGEQMLSERGNLKQYDALKVAHHGSKNSSTESFLKCIMPKTAFISAGIDNRYGHPHKETLERLESVKTRIYSTIESGAVTLLTDGKKLQIKTYLEKQ